MKIRIFFPPSFRKILRHLPWYCCTPLEERQNLSHLWNIIVSQIFNIDWCKNQLILNYLLHFIMYIWSKTEYIYRLFFIMFIIKISYPCPFHHFCLFFPRPISRTCKSYIYAYQNNWSQKELVLVEHGESILFFYWNILTGLSCRAVSFKIIVYLTALYHKSFSEWLHCGVYLNP